MTPVSHETELLTKIAKQIGIDITAAPHIHYNRKNDMLEAILEHIENGESRASSQIIPITYDELLLMVKANRLQPAAFYRITDYVTTTAQEESRSAMHQFDIIVHALSSSTLDSSARAIKHEGDHYFEKSNLSKWQISYDINNDKQKYVWADDINGKGVIYRMIDEFSNDVAYDFKNIQFKRYKVQSVTNIINIDIFKNDDIYYSTNIPIKDFTINSDDYRWYYTFNSIADVAVEDASLNDYKVYNNFVDICLDAEKKLILNNNVFFGDVFQNVVGENSSINTIKIFNNNNINIGFAGNIAINMTTNVIIRNFHHNVCNNIFSNNIGANFSNNVVAQFQNNIVLGFCQNNYLGWDFSLNHVELNFQNNKVLGSDCKLNNFGGNFKFNTIGKTMWGNKFGLDVMRCSFGDTFQFNHIGAYCKYCSFNKSQTYLLHVGTNLERTAAKPLVIADFNNRQYDTTLYIDSIGGIYATWKVGITDVYQKYNETTKTWEPVTP